MQNLRLLSRTANFGDSLLKHTRRVPSGSRQLGTDVSQTVPHLVAHDLSCSKTPSHVRDVRKHLDQKGLLKITLQFPDDKSKYLENLVTSLHEQHGHGLPIAHSSSRGWFWDVRPDRTTTCQPGYHQARSETMEDFPWHTDCSYEHAPPRFFALHVLQPDRLGGGTLSVMEVQTLVQTLPSAVKEALCQPNYQIAIPPEFIKQPDQQRIIGSLVALDPLDRRSTMVRFRGEIVTPLTERAAIALQTLKDTLRSPATSDTAIHLTADDLPAGSIILLNNHRWLHARNNIHDPSRHLRRVRWDAFQFPSGTE